MRKEHTIKISKRGKEKLRRQKKRGEDFEDVIMRRPLVSDLISKQNLRRLRKESFITRNAIIQDVLDMLERRRKK